MYQRVGPVRRAFASEVLHRLDREERRPRRVVRVGGAGDAAESRADEIARRMVAGQDQVRRGTAPGADAADGEIDRSVLDVARNDPGRPLPDALRRSADHVVGTSAGKVRLHTGRASAAAADRLGAQAFAHGNDVFFGAGRYRPGTAAGDELIAHEVAHATSSDGAVHRRLNFDADRLNKARSIKGRIAAHQEADLVTYIKRMVRQYQSTNDPNVRTDRLNTLENYIKEWFTKVPDRESTESFRIGDVLDDLQMEIEAERLRLAGENKFMETTMQKAHPRGLKEGKAAYEERIAEQRGAWQRKANRHGVSEAEMYALDRYKGQGYRKINPAIAGSKSWSEAQNPDVAGAWTDGAAYAGLALSGISRLPPVTGQFWRGFRADPAEIETQYRKGSTIVLSSITSVSPNQGVSRAFAHGDNLTPENQTAQVMLSVRSKTARDFRPIFGNGEAELVLMPGVTLKVVMFERLDQRPDWGARNPPTWYQIIVQEV